MEAACEEGNGQACMFLDDGLLDLTRLDLERRSPASSGPVRVVLSRLRGTPDIRPSTAVMHNMRRNGLTQLNAEVQFCISRRGTIRSARLQRRSGAPLYDRRLIEKVRNWRFRPIIANGKPLRVYTSEKFSFSIQR